MKKRVLFVGLLVLAAGFLWGFAASHYKVFPYGLAKSIWEDVRGDVGNTSKGLKFLPEAYVFTDTTNRENVSCAFDNPLVFLAIGQSNAANFLSTFGDAIPTAKAYQFFDGRCYLIEDPVLGATGERGSLWPEFAQRLSETAGRPVVFLTAAVGGSALELWIADESSYYDRTAKQVALARAAGLSVDFVLWLQGETDALRNTPQQVYMDGLETLIDRLDGAFESGAEPRWIIFQASICRRLLASSPEILAAQRAVAESSPRALLGPNGDRLLRRYRHDDCHFNADGKAEIIAELEEIVLQELNR
jgi:hypothetical protein